MDWTDDAIARLRELWAHGLSTAKIGALMGISKNAVVGKAHRLRLPSRPSPIRLAASVARRATSETAPSAATTAEPVVEAAPETVEPPSTLDPAPEPMVATPKPAVEIRPMEPVARSPVRRPALRPVPPAPRIRSTAACCWPIGEPGTPQFHFCDAEAATGRPYCAEHVQIAYVRVRDRREDAA